MCEMLVDNSFETRGLDLEIMMLQLQSDREPLSYDAAVITRRYLCSWGRHVGSSGSGWHHRRSTLIWRGSRWGTLYEMDPQWRLCKSRATQMCEYKFICSTICLFLDFRIKECIKINCNMIMCWLMKWAAIHPFLCFLNLLIKITPDLKC